MRANVDVKASKAITLVVDSGASKLLLPTNEGLKSVQQANGRVMYANAEQGLLKTKGALDVNGNEVAGCVSNRLTEGLLSVGQMDAMLGAQQRKKVTFDSHQ